jgi:hypothetical protein
MKQKLIEGITGTDTFETWFDKTNEMIDFTNTKANVVKVEIDYSGTIHGVPITSRVLNINAPGFTLSVGEPVFSITRPDNDISGQLDTVLWDLGHASMFGRANGGSMFLATWTSQGDGWGTQADAHVQQSLYGIISKIISNDTVNKKTLLEVCRPGGSFDIKFADLKSPSWKWYGNRFYLDNIKKGGRYFLGILGADSNGGNTGAFFQDVGYHDAYEAPASQYPVTDAGLDTTRTNGLDYLVITPYNDADETLNVYLHPNAPKHNKVQVSSIAAGISYGSGAIVSIEELTIPSKDKNNGIPSSRTVSFDYRASDPLGLDQQTGGIWTQIKPQNFTNSGKVRILTVKTDTNTHAQAANSLIFIQNYGTADSFTMIHEGGNWNQVGYATGIGSWASLIGYLNIVYAPDGSFWVLNRLLQNANASSDPIKLSINEIG